MFRNGTIIGSKDEWDESVVNLLYYLFLYMADMTRGNFQCAKVFPGLINISIIR